jgi:epoxide hydrolase
MLSWTHARKLSGHSTARAAADSAQTRPHTSGLLDVTEPVTSNPDLGRVLRLRLTGFARRPVASDRFPTGRGHRPFTGILSEDGAVTPLEPFLIDVGDADLVDLRRRLSAARWPSRETVSDWSQGLPLAVLRELCEHWQTAYDWRATERRLNRLPHYRTAIDGLSVHFIHLRSPVGHAIPLIMTHGWPGSFFEFEQVLERLADPAAFGEALRPAFHVVVPSLPGYGFSDAPTRPGWNIHRIAAAWAELMNRLGYSRFIALGSDWGTSISTSLALNHRQNLIGLHLIPPLVPPPAGGELTEREQASIKRLEARNRTSSAYSQIQATMPQTLGYSLVDSPVGLCAWILEKVWNWSDHEGELWEVLSPDQVLDNITLYWLTRSGASSARLYWESISEVTAWFTRPGGEPITVPTGCTVFPQEVPRPYRRWAEPRFPAIVHWGEPARGGHFGAWEQPELFISEVRAVAEALRSDG